MGCRYGRVGGGASCRIKLNMAFRVMYIISMNMLLLWTGDLSYATQQRLFYLCQNQAPLLLRAPHVQFCYSLWSEMHSFLEPSTEKEIYVHDS